MPEGFRIAAAYVQVKPDMDGFDEELRSKLREATAGADGRVHVTLDTAELDAKLAQVHSKLDELAARRAEPSVRLNDADFTARLDEIRARLDELGARTARPGLRLADADFTARLDEARARLDAMDGRRASARLDLDTAEFNAKLDEARARLAMFRDETARARLGAIGSFGGGVGGEGSGGFGLAGGIAPIAGGLAGLLPGLGGAATGLGLLGGAGFLGLGGIAGALSAKRQATQSQNQGQAAQGAQQAETAFSNAVAIQQAQEQIGNARSQAGQDAVTSAHNIEQAQQSLASVERSAAQSQVQALQQVQQAEQGVEEANYGLREAQYQMNQAWEQARENIAQLNDQLADSKLNVQAAQLAIQQAIVSQRQVDSNAYATDVQRQQAALAVAQAQQQLKDAQDSQTAAQYKANEANKAGVAGSQQVIQAKQALTQAQYAQSNAQQQYADTQTNLKNTELNNAQQIKAAQEQLSAAQEQAAYQRQVDARNISDAERNLTNTLKQQQLQAAATAATQNQAADTFATDMAKLTPAARRVVEQILGMSGAWQQMKKVAQNALAPGVSVFLTGLSKLLPTITTGIGRMGTVLGQAFSALGKAMQSPAGAKVLQGLIDNGVRFAQIVIPAFGRFVGALADVGSKKGAVDGLANLIGGLADGLANLVKGLSPFTDVLSSVFSTLGKALAPVGTLLGQTIGSIAQALAPALQAMLPAFKELVAALGNGLTVALQALGPVLKPIGMALAAVALAVAPLLPVFGQLIAQVAQALAPVLMALVPVIRQLAALLVRDLQDGLLKLLGAIMPILPAAGKLIISLMPLINVVLKVAGVLIGLVSTILGPVVGAIAKGIAIVLEWVSHWQEAVRAIETGALWLWHNVFDPLWHGIEQGATWLYNNAIMPLQNGIDRAFSWIGDKANQLWHGVFDPLWQGIKSGASSFVSAFETTWNTLKDVFRKPVSFLINTVYDNGIARLWNDVVDKIGLGKLDLPKITGFAAGGVVPGYAPGRDTVPAMLSPGEGVLVPEAVQAIGSGTVHSLNAAYGRGRTSSDGHYAGGGIIGSAWNAVKSAVSGALDVGKIVAALATGNGTALTNALGKLVGTNAVGDYAQVMLGFPRKMISEAVHALIGMFSSSGGSVGGSIPSGQHLSIIDAALQAAGVPPPGTKAQWEAGLNTLITRESDWNPRAINLTDSNAAAGDPSRGLGQAIMSTFLAYHAPGTSTDIYDPVANVASITRYIVARYGNISNVQQANANLPPKGYDSGGWLMPGDMPVNGLRRPEAVLTPEQSDAFIQIVRHLATQSGSGLGAGRPVTVEQHFHGTQWPTAEQKANMQRELALALSGA